MHRLVHHFVIFTAVALSVDLATAQQQASALPGTYKGIHFEHDLSWAQIKAKANSEQKYIFVDCFTTWCGPCQYMRNTAFPQKVMGNFFNDKFVNVEVQLDTTKKDDDRVKAWYVDAHALMTQYSIQAFPTYLIFAPDGRIIHRIVGSSEPVKFIPAVEEAFDTTKQYYTRLRQFEMGRRDSGFLRRLAEYALDVYDLHDGTRIYGAWLATQSNPLTPTSVKLAETLTRTTTDPGFDLFFRHGAQVDKILGAGSAGRIVTGILIREYVSPQTHSAGPEGPDWKAIHRTLAAKYPNQADEVEQRGKVQYFQRKQDWPNFQTAIAAYMRKYGSHATAAELNSFAHTVFNNCPDMSCVANALDWSRRSFKDKPNPDYMDTYANILYKMGKKDEAIAWEEKARDLAEEQDRAGYNTIIDKMKKGEKTWN